jgi:hypothetical protein
MFSDDALEGREQETACLAGALMSNKGVKAVVKVGVGGKVRVGVAGGVGTVRVDTGGRRKKKKKYAYRLRYGDHIPLHQRHRPSLLLYLSVSFI